MRAICFRLLLHREMLGLRAGFKLAEWRERKEIGSKEKGSSNELPFSCFVDGVCLKRAVGVCHLPTGFGMVRVDADVAFVA